jgi:hypothetical protein
MQKNIKTNTDFEVQSSETMCVNENGLEHKWHHNLKLLLSDKKSEPKINCARYAVFLFYHKLKYHEQKCKIYRTANILTAVKIHSKA